MDNPPEAHGCSSGRDARGPGDTGHRPARKGHVSASTSNSRPCSAMANRSVMPAT